MFGISREKSVVGLDIGSYSVKVVELRARKKGSDEAYEVLKIGYEPLPHDATVEGPIIDSAAVVETIRLVFDESKISNKDVAISISGNSVIIKKISLPVMEKQELAESIIWEAKHNIPYPYEETNVDYAILKPARSTDEKNLDILLVAAKKDKIANYSNVINQARKNLRKELSISFEEAEKLLKGIPGKSTTQDQFATLLQMNVRDLLDEIEKTYSSYAAPEQR